MLQGQVKSFMEREKQLLMTAEVNGFFPDFLKDSDIPRGTDDQMDLTSLLHYIPPTTRPLRVTSGRKPPMKASESGYMDYVERTASPRGE